MNRVPAIIARRVASAAGIRLAVQRAVPAVAAVQARTVPIRALATAPQDAVPGPTSSGRRDYGTPQEEDSPWSIPMYILSGLLISGSIYYANNATLKPEDLYEIDADPHAVYGPVSEQALADDAAERALLTFGDTLWARFQNWWTYPSAVRTPLRNAILYHKYLPDSGSEHAGAQAEAFYLTAYAAACDDTTGCSLAVRAGIALQIAQFYRDHTRARRALAWYRRGAEALAAWYLADDERNNHRRTKIVWASPAGAAKLERLAAVLANEAQAADAMRRGLGEADEKKVGDTGGAVPAVAEFLSPDAYYTMALSTLFLARDAPTAADNAANYESAVRTHLEHVLRHVVVTPPPALVAAATRTLAVPGAAVDDQPLVANAGGRRSAALTALLEEMAAYYSARGDAEYAAPLRRLQLAHMPSTAAADARDVQCRRATVLNNLADDLIMLAYLARREAEGATAKDVAERATRRGDAHLTESIKVLQRALDASSGAAKKSPECGACRVAVLNNLGRAEEEAGEPVAAAKYLHKALAEARTLGLVDARREVQVNLTRVQEQVATGRKRN
ncbi:hypothetical protein GGF31_000105 [Allomyces arbusculus]|nr:hypothetical protein GGF31_000105 [Allomyces arbusculus]